MLHTPKVNAVLLEDAAQTVHWHSRNQMLGPMLTNSKPKKIPLQPPPPPSPPWTLFKLPTPGDGGTSAVGDCGWLVGWLRDNWAAEDNDDDGFSKSGWSSSELGPLTLLLTGLRAGVWPVGWSISALMPQPYTKDDSAWKCASSTSACMISDIDQLSEPVVNFWKCKEVG